MAHESSILVGDVHRDELWHSRPVKRFESWVKEGLAGQAGGEEPVNIGLVVKRVGGELEDLDQNGPLQILPLGDDARRGKLRLLMALFGRVPKCSTGLLLPRGRWFGPG